VANGSPEWRALAGALIRAEIEALQRSVEFDRGEVGGTIKDSLVKPPASVAGKIKLGKLFEDYIASRQAVGLHRDGGKNWHASIERLVGFLKQDDASKITKRNLLDWRDAMLAEGLSAKTISDKHLAAVRAVMRWAFENDRLASNEMATVSQDAPRRTHSRERGYTLTEAETVIRASIAYSGSVKERAWIIAAKRWVPLLCAFTGARVTEITQLRKEDVRQEAGRWVIRITPDAGTVKTGQYRDVPLHQQVVDLGFVEFAQAAGDGPLFHGARDAAKYLANARVTAGRLSEWLNAAKLVPDGVQPSLGWRHRFKTIGRELGESDRVLDAIQGHPGRTASDGYGDVTLKAKLRVIDALGDIDLC
jgi:integrase